MLSANTFKKMLLMYGAKHQIMKHFLLTVTNISALREQQELLSRINDLTFRGCWYIFF